MVWVYLPCLQQYFHQLVKKSSSGAISLMLSIATSQRTSSIMHKRFLDFFFFKPNSKKMQMFADTELRHCQTGKKLAKPGTVC